MSEFEENELEEELDNVIKLIDDEGKEVKFEFLDFVEYDSEQYVVLFPMEDNEAEDEVVILKVEETEDDEEQETYVSVDDQEVLNKVFDIFKEKFKDEFNFIDEE